MIPWWAPELFREFLFWASSPVTRPWGAIGLALVLCCCASFVAGALLGICLVSPGCRRCLVSVGRSLVAALAREVLAGWPDHRGRLAEYRH